jgi:peptide-methionine (S)-S-oxide reductase
VLWTRVGYTGGATPSPSYSDLRDHTEALEVGFDPTKLSYDALLAEFWAAHDPVSVAGPVQYRNAVFVHDPAQRASAERSRAQVAQRLGEPVTTAIEDAGTFWQAEGYHQKWNLRLRGDLLDEVQAAYPDVDDLVRSTAAARLNAWVGGWSEAASIDRDVDALGLSEPAEAAVRALVTRPGATRALPR